MMMRQRACVVLLMACLGDMVWAQQVDAPLETLFYTPAQRAAMERARRGWATATDAPANAVQKLTGVLKREGGRGTVWINGKPSPEEAQQAPRIRELDAVVKGKRLRVGESLDANTGERADVVAPGAVKVRPAP